MPFKAILRNLVERIPGATGAAMLDWEGEAVDHYSNTPELDMPAIGAHKGIILNFARDAMVQIRKDGGTLNPGKTSDPSDSIKTISISTESAGIAISTIKEGYYLVVTMQKGKPLARAFFESRKTVREIEEEMR